MILDKNALNKQYTQARTTFSLTQNDHHTTTVPTATPLSPTYMHANIHIQLTPSTPNHPLNPLLHPPPRNVFRVPWNLYLAVGQEPGGGANRSICVGWPPGTELQNEIWIVGGVGWAV